MAKRRRLAGLASGLAGGVGDVAMLLLQNQMIGGRQQEQRENMTLQAVLTNLLSQKGSIADAVTKGDMTPEQASAKIRTLEADLPGFLRGRLDFSGDYTPLAPSRASRLAPIGASIEGATSPEAVPTATGIRRRALERNVTPDVTETGWLPNVGTDPTVLPSRSFQSRTTQSPDITALIEEALGRRTDLLAGQPREAVGDYDAAGNKITTFLSEREQAGRTTRGERTPEEEASFAVRGQQASNVGGLPGLKGEAVKRETLSGLLSPEVTKAEVSKAARTAGAERSAQLAAELAQMGITGQQQTAALTLADDFERASSEFFTVDRSFKRIATLARTPSPMGDIGMVFAIMKMYDPPSTVREGEQAQASNAAGVPERIRATYNRLLSGERLGEGQRADIVGTARNLYTTAKADQDQIVQDFTDRARQMRIDPSLVLRAPAPVPDSPFEWLDRMLRELRKRSGGVR